MTHHRNIIRHDVTPAGSSRDRIQTRTFPISKFKTNMRCGPFFDLESGVMLLWYNYLISMKVVEGGARIIMLNR